MKIIVVILTVCVLFAQAGCKKDPILPKPIPEDPYRTILDVKWKRLFHSDTLVYYFLDPYFFGDNVGFCTEMNAFGVGELGLVAFHKSTGERHPAWKNDPANMVDGADITDWRIAGTSANIGVLTDRRRLYAYDLSSGQLLWKHDHSPFSGNHRFDKLGTDILHTYGPGALSQSWLKIGLFKAETGSKRDLLTLHIENNYEFYIMTPATFYSSVNDTILLFLKNGWNFSLVDGIVDAYAYNLTADTLMWVSKDIEVNGNATTYTPLVAQNKVVFQCNRSIHCFDIFTGQMLWEHEFTDMGFAASPNLYADGKVFARSHSDEVIAFDLNSGQILWKTPKNYGVNTGGSMDYYKGKLYLTAIDMRNGNIPDLLFCLDANTGTLLWKDCPIWLGGLSDGIIIDQTTGYLYCNNGAYIFCIDLNNTPLPGVKPKYPVILP